MIKRIITILVLLFSFSCGDVRASHIVGGDFSYKYLGDTIEFGVVKQKYLVTLYIYQDCITGASEAINEDNPAFFTLYDNDNAPFVLAPPPQSDSIYFNPATGAITVPGNFSNECVSKIPQICLLRKRFDKIYKLPVNSTGYTVVYQRCCRNSSILNVIDPGNKGATYFCTIPPAVRNNSAVFKNYPPQIICINNPMYYDNSATDADGDSLTYEFCKALEGATGDNIKPFRASPPPYDDDSVKYYPPYTPRSPMSGFPPIIINPLTGIISGTPNRAGRYLVTVCCNEWRNGLLINTVKREFQFVVTDCSKIVIADVPLFSDAPNTYIINCKDFDVFFVNKSSGGFAYRWTFDVEGNPGATSTDFEPKYTYPDTGTYTIKLVVNPTSTCPDSIVRLVKIYPRFKADFLDSGMACPGSVISFIDKTATNLKPITSWRWTFGDGDSSYTQSPEHRFKRGGTYNVVLISENIKNCLDTSLKRVVIQDFTPYAGDDTIIVKGESIQFEAQGGTSYAWSPAEYLSDTAIRNPRATYNDTGFHIYSVFVESEFGCNGYDSIAVLVVNNPSFVVPNAFSPNGDGLNDVFKPRAVGYRNLKYFRIFNRWGEEVYVGTTLETGWDGTFKGRPAELGVFFWQINFVDRFGKEGLMQGDVTLIR